ncbi:BACON domain-containing carbohydrate-binding protein [uncultured Bacteroides sp.]|uniref:BACON domain-containing protein n=1 Tax=uncultured Bacteroides sp. TaxID=162156 RepID=UPI002635F98C|nr:BACON domain-containing carbohydrate-binding protein [uncultured Bacteroides sp.]
MKKLLFYIIALLSVASALSGCKKDEEATELPPPVISVKEPKTYSCGEKSYSVRYSIENPRKGVKLEAATGTKWITSLGVSEDAITFTLMENSSDKERSGSIELSYQGAEPVSLKIKQYEYSETPVISAPQLIDIGCYGGAKSILYQIKNPDDNGELKANSDVDWISAILIEEEKISFTVGENLSDSERTGRIILSYNGAESVKVTVKQKKYTAPEIQVQTQSFDVSFIGGNRSTEYKIINPKEGVKLNATTKAECDWITNVDIDDKKISFIVEENETGQDRSDKITLNYNDGAATLEITVNQGNGNHVSSLDEKGTANCYIVSKAGYYQFKAVKGNSEETVGTISTAEVLWESFCTDVAPNKGDLISEVYAGNGKVFFKTGDTFKSGNAVIAVKDASGNILWSWHIWMPEELPIDQLYKNGAGTMMDRNLGATNIVKFDPRSYGLLYQWGRKDPFLAPSTRYDVSPPIKAASTITWPDPMGCNENTGTIEYTIENPTTFITGGDWLYDMGNAEYSTRWSRNKSIYDPCPPGYRAPNGGSNGVWAKVFGPERKYKSYELGGGYDFGNELCIENTPCWYPVTGSYDTDGELFEEYRKDWSDNGIEHIPSDKRQYLEYVYVWSCDYSNKYYAHDFFFINDTIYGGTYEEYNFCPDCTTRIGEGHPVRCQKIE